MKPRYPTECFSGGVVLGELETIRVQPVDGGWLLSCPSVGEPLAFLSGLDAESQAYALGACLAELGRDARVLVHDAAAGLSAARWFPARTRGRRLAAARRSELS